jgi:PKD repeat protein
VRLTVTDGQHGVASVLHAGAVAVDPIQAAFTAAPLTGAAPLQVQFTDASTGPVTAWAWDFDNDGLIDSTLQNPSFTYAAPGAYTVRLRASSACNAGTVIQRDFVTVVQATSNVRSPELLEFQFNEVRGQTVANTAATSVMPPVAQVSNAGWQGDPGRAAWRGNEAGAGMLANTGGMQNLNLVNCLAPLTVTGSMTVAWWQRLGPVPPPGAAYVFGGTGAAAVRCFTGGVAGPSLCYRGSTVGDVAATTSVQNQGVWQHVALVIDDNARQATWYFDGVPEPPVPLSAAHMAYIAELHVGWHTPGNGSYTANYDLDDFRIYARALSASAIAQVMAAEDPTAGSFGQACAGPVAQPVIGANGVPVLGNAGFGVRLQSAEDRRLCCIVLGLAPRRFGVLDLGSVLGPGCALYVDWFNTIFHVTSGGSALQPMPVPNTPALSGFHVYVQWLVDGTVGAATSALDLNIR